MTFKFREIKLRADFAKMAAQRDFIVTLINAGKSKDEIQSLTKDCYGTKAYTRRAINKISANISAGGDGKDGRRGAVPWIRINSNIELIKTLVDDDGRITLDEMVEETNLSRTTIYRILKIDLGYSIDGSPSCCLLSKKWRE